MWATITISEFKDGKNLEEFVKDFYKKNLNGQIYEEKVFIIFGRIIGSFKALYESFKVCHRDLKHENMLISTDNLEPLLLLLIKPFKNSKNIKNIMVST